MKVKPGEIFALFISVIFLTAAEIEIRFSGSDKLIKKLRESIPRPTPEFYLQPLLKLKRTRLISLVEAADRNLGWKSSCLRRTIALAGLSRKLGLAPVFKIGVMKQNEILRAHSWLELDGIQLEMDDEAASYLVLSPAEKLK